MVCERSCNDETGWIAEIHNPWSIVQTIATAGALTASTLAPTRKPTNAMVIVIRHCA